MQEGRYRKNATVIVTDGAGRVLLCERVKSIYGGVQSVQGGVDDGETLESAAKRELWEEIGLAEDQYTLQGPLATTWTYDYPQEYIDANPPGSPIGQEQHYFLATTKPDASFDLEHHSQEFSRVGWGTPQEMIDGIWERKRDGMTAALCEFGLYS